MFIARSFPGPSVGLHLRRRPCREQSRRVTPLGKTRQACWQGVHKVNSQVTVSSLERANFLALRAGEAEGIDLLFLELAYEVLRFAGAGERAGDEPVGLAPGGHVRLVPVEQASGVALDPAPVEFQRLD